jgi:bifunctional non-homologous end joining protein LigD
MTKTIELSYTEGSSDKIYQASIQESGDGYVVNFAYGRRGNTLATGSKTPVPVTVEKAELIYNKLIHEKMSKGYKEVNNGGNPTVVNHTEARQTDFLPQLLNEIEESDLEKYLNSDDWCAQEKYDGVRRGVLKRDGKAIGTNRKGLTVQLPQDTIDLIENGLKASDFTWDGEALGDTVMLFDCIIPELPKASYHLRYAMLKETCRHNTGHLLVAPTAWTRAEKIALLEKLRMENAEGIVFKNIRSPYVPGRPNSGGDQLKFKFHATASCVVIGINENKRSISLGVYDMNHPESIIEVGNTTVYPNQQVPKVGAIVEVRYLYYFPGGSLFQPVLLGEREDMEYKDCVITQLKLKQGTETE